MNSEQNMNIPGFVNSVIQRCKTGDTGFGAVMRRADNPNQCSAAWEYLVPYCDLSSDYQRLPFALTGAAIAREKPEQDGSSSVGQALRTICQGDQDAVEREAMRLRRLIGCNTAMELIPVLRPILGYLQSKGASLSYCTLLKDLIYWNEKIRIRWAKDFYGKSATAEEPEAGKDQ